VETLPGSSSLDRHRRHRVVSHPLTTVGVASR